MDYRNLMSVTEFAAFRRLTRVSVYRAIKNGEIVAVRIGEREVPYIDAAKYADFTPQGKARGVGRSNYQKCDVQEAEGISDEVDYATSKKALAKHFGLPVSVYNDSLEVMAVEIEKGALSDVPDDPISYSPRTSITNLDEFPKQDQIELPSSSIDTIINLAVVFINRKFGSSWETDHYISYWRHELIDLVGYW